MSGFLEPSPLVLAWLVTRKFLWAELILVLALGRLMLGPGGARLPALGSVLVSGAVVLTVFAPALGLGTGGAYATAVAVTNHLQGLTVLVLSSLLLLAAAFWRYRPSPKIELLAALLTLGGIALWFATQV